MGPQLKRELILFYLYFYVPEEGSFSGAGDGTETALVHSASVVIRAQGGKGRARGSSRENLAFCGMAAPGRWLLFSLLV